MLRRLADMFLRPRPADGEVTVVESGAAALEAATAEARATLPIFWKVFDDDAADSYQLKVGLATPNGATEHIWIYPGGWRDEKVFGILANQPADLVDVAAGDEILVDPARISDWGYSKGGRLYGAFTQRATLDRLSRGTRRQVEAALSPTPLEPGKN